MNRIFFADSKLKHALITNQKSSLNLFLILPILICLCLGCFCKADYRFESCTINNGEKLALLGSKLQLIDLIDGTLNSAKSGGESNILCTESDEVITFAKEFKDKNRNQLRRTAIWGGDLKTYILADNEYLEKYTGYIQNRYFVSSSRAYIEKSKDVRSGKNTTTVRYNVYTQPQVFSIEDSSTGEVKSHYLSRDKFDLPESVFYDDLRFYALNLSPDGIQTFALVNNHVHTVAVYRLNMFTGELTQIGKQMSLLVPEGQKFETIHFEPRGRYAVVAMRSTMIMLLNIEVLDFERGEVVFKKELRGISFNNDSPEYVFDQTGENLAIYIEGHKFDPTRKVKDLTTVNLADGTENSLLNLQKIFGKPENAQLLYVNSDETVLAYQDENRIDFLAGNTYICKINNVTGGVIWKTKLTE